MTTENEVTEMIRRCARDPDMPREALCKMLEIAADHIEGQERVWQVASQWLKPTTPQERWPHPMYGVAMPERVKP